MGFTWNSGIYKSSLEPAEEELDFLMCFLWVKLLKL